MGVQQGPAHPPYPVSPAGNRVPGRFSADKPKTKPFRVFGPGPQPVTLQPRHGVSGGREGRRAWLGWRAGPGSVLSAGSTPVTSPKTLSCPHNQDPSHPSEGARASQHRVLCPCSHSVLREGVTEVICPFLLVSSLVNLTLTPGFVTVLCFLQRMEVVLPRQNMSGGTHTCVQVWVQVHVVQGCGHVQVCVGMYFCFGIMCTWPGVSVSCCPFTS